MKTAEITHTNVNFPTRETVLFFLNYSMVLLQGQDEASEKNNTFSTFADMLFMRKVFLLLFCIILFLYCWIVTTRNRPGHVMMSSKKKDILIWKPHLIVFLKCMSVNFDKRLK